MNFLDNSRSDKRFISTTFTDIIPKYNMHFDASQNIKSNVI